MKGVGMIRLQFRPVAECEIEDCDFRYPSFGQPSNATIRAAAEQHAFRTGHEVRVDILDRTVYSKREDPEVTA